MDLPDDGCAGGVGYLDRHMIPSAASGVADSIFFGDSRTEPVPGDTLGGAKV
jgi:hypothetical protein